VRRFIRAAIAQVGVPVSPPAPRKGPMARSKRTRNSR
jgi:hypothetical protein